ncbi:Uncharacterised protein [Serratia quinivorans]|nr:Uncharacterised protein [Serratia quinivorans]CAI1152341.1 Uncharacterised protein [Serratia quinivorans]CAI2150251.1 Uncharacterised protein [Serratia quinivorans]
MDGVFIIIGVLIAITCFAFYRHYRLIGGAKVNKNKG